MTQPGLPALSPDANDQHPNDPGLVVSVQELSDQSTPWMRWPGHWGSIDDESPALAFDSNGLEREQWSDPGSWDGGGITSNCTSPQVGGGSRVLSAPDDQPAPSIRWAAGTDDSIVVSWSIPHSAWGQAQYLEIAIRRTDVRAPAIRVVEPVAERHSGTVSMRVPAGTGRYDLAARMRSRSGIFGSTAVADPDPR